MYLSYVQRFTLITLVLIIFSGCAATKRNLDMWEKGFTYKDTIVTYENKDLISSNQTKPVLFWPGMKDAYDRYVFIDVLACDCEEFKVRFRISHCGGNKLPSYEIRPSDFPAVTDIYDSYESFRGKIYHGQTETEEYYKIARIYVVIQNEYNDKIKRKPNLKQNLARIQLKLVDEIKELNGDGALDLCLYRSDYKELNRKNYGNRTTIIYSDKMLLTATVIKFKNGFLLDNKYLLKSGDDSLNAVKDK